MQAVQPPIKSHRDLSVWQKGMQLVDDIYGAAEALPARERFGLWSQLTRAGVSVPVNIAEGRARGTAKDFANFLVMARSSLIEIDTLLLVVGRRGYATCRGGWVASPGRGIE
jgi:four helix bundle protein